MCNIFFYCTVLFTHFDVVKYNICSNVTSYYAKGYVLYISKRKCGNATNTVIYKVSTLVEIGNENEYTIFSSLKKCAIEKGILSLFLF